MALEGGFSHKVIALQMFKMLHFSEKFQQKNGYEKNEIDIIRGIEDLRRETQMLDSDITWQGRYVWCLNQIALVATERTIHENNLTVKASLYL